MASTSEQIPEQPAKDQKPLDILEEIAKEFTPDDLMSGGKIIGLLLHGILKSGDAKDKQINILIWVITGIAIFLAGAAVGLAQMVP